MSPVKAGLLAFLIILLAIQLLQPDRNQNGGAAREDIGNVLSVPENIQGILKKSCYDCHSEHMGYPWYMYIQPVGWWMDMHIREGKDELNFNAFGAYSRRRQLSKLKSIAESVEDGTMPLPSYTLIHKNARLSKKDKTLILKWIKNTKDSLLLNH